MSESASASSNVCYRHPNRQSYVLCQRCGRTICPECQTQAAVGVQCPECVREGRASVPRPKSRIAMAFRPGSGKPVVTWSIIAICLVVFGLQNIPGGFGQLVTVYGAYQPRFTEQLPWTMITSAFLHGGILHILFNMYSLFIIGPLLERMLGRGRFIALYLLSAFGGSVAVLLLAPNGAVYGASGAIFGLFAAFFVIQRKLGGTNVQLLVIIGLNLVIGFVLPNVSWQAHVGGLVAGAAVALVYLRTRRAAQKNAQILMVSLVGVALIVLTIVGLVIHS